MKIYADVFLPKAAKRRGGGRPPARFVNISPSPPQSPPSGENALSVTYGSIFIIFIIVATATRYSDSPLLSTLSPGTGRLSRFATCGSAAVRSRRPGGVKIQGLPQQKATAAWRFAKKALPLQRVSRGRPAATVIFMYNLQKKKDLWQAEET